MAPTAPIMRIGSSLSGAPTAPPPTSTGPTSLPEKPAGPPPAPFDRASAFKERLQATKARAEAGLPSRPASTASTSTAPPPRAGPPRPPVAQQPVAAHRPPAAQPMPYSSPSLVYPIGGPRTTSAPPAPAPSSSSAYTATSPRQPGYGAYAYTPPLQPQPQPQQYYQHSMPSAATPFYLPSSSHPHPQLSHPYPSSFASPYAAYPPAAPTSAPHYPSPPPTLHDTQTWPAPEIEWRRAPPPAPPVPAGLTSDGRATDYGAVSGGEAQTPTPAKGQEQAQAQAQGQQQASERRDAHEPASPRARRRSSATTGTAALPFPSGFIAPLSGVDLDDASHDLLDGLHYLLLTSPSLPSLPSTAPELSSLELALLDIAIRAEGVDVAGERDAVRERWAAVERKWTARTTRVLKLEDRQAGIVAALVEKVAELELEGEQAQARAKRLEAGVTAAKGELEEQKERAERAEAKLVAKPSQRVGLLLEDLKKVTAARDALAAELDDARSALASAQTDLARLRRPSSAFLATSARSSTALDRASEPSNAPPREPDDDRARAVLEAELRRAREAHDADRMIADERVRALRAEADELRRALARRAAASTFSSGGGASGAPAAGQPAAGASLVGAAIERELESAKAELTKKGFVLTRLAEKVKELNRELEGKARENADLLDRLAGVAPRTSSASTAVSP
ncbi:hypothetical protein JCM9279_003802 [Rhodotorula babjevae]